MASTARREPTPKARPKKAAVLAAKARPAARGKTGLLKVTASDTVRARTKSPSPAKAAKAQKPKPRDTVKKTVAVKAAAAKKAPAGKTAAKKAAPVRAAAAAPRPAKPAAKTPVRAPIAASAQAVPEPKFDLAAHDKELTRTASAAAVNRALDLLEILARGGPISAVALLDAAGRGRTLSQDALAALRARDFVIEDDASGLCRLGARWSVLGRAANEQGAFAATAMPFLTALGNQTGENVYLRVRVGMECETVALYQTDPALRVYTEVGKRMPLHAGSGRILLAYAPEAVQTQVLAQRLQRFTPSTRIDPTWIAADLHRIRQRGFLITDSEVVAGTVSVCAPVRDTSGQVVASLLIGAPSLRMRPPRPRGLMPMVVEAARKLSEALGYVDPHPAPLRVTAPVPETRRPAAMAAATGGAPMPAAAMGAAMARPHSIFR